MAYGDSALWIGTVPVASPAAEFTIEFKCEFEDGTESECKFSVYTGQEEFEVAALLCAHWNKQHGGGAGYNSKKKSKRHRVRFDRDVKKMWVTGYLPNQDPHPGYREVQFGTRTEVLKDYDASKFGVFNG